MIFLKFHSIKKWWLDEAIQIKRQYFIKLSLLWLAFFSLAFIYHGRFISENLIQNGHDIIINYIPNFQYLADSLRQGSFPWWSFDLNLGIPYWQDVQKGVFIPWNYLGYFFSATQAYAIAIILVLSLNGLFFYKFLDVFSLSVPARFIGGVLWMFSGYLINKVTLYNLFNVTPFIFLLIYASYRLVFDEKERLLKYTLLGGIAAAFLLFSGPPMLIYYGYFWAFFLAYWFIKANNKARVPLALLPWLVGLVIAWPQIVGTLELLPYSYRSGGLTLEMSGIGSLPLENFPKVHFPDIGEPSLGFGENVDNSSGLRLIFALIAILAIMANRTRRKDTIFLCLIYAAGLLISFGISFPKLHQFLFEHMPLLKYLRFPNRWLFFSSSALCALAAIGSDYLFKTGENARSLLLKDATIVLTAPLLLILYVWLSNFEGGDFYIWFVIGAIYYLCLFVFSLPKDNGHYLLPAVALCVVVILDSLTSASQGIVGFYNRGVSADAFRPSHKGHLEILQSGTDLKKVATINKKDLENAVVNNLSEYYSSNFFPQIEIAKLTNTILPTTNLLFRISSLWNHLGESLDQLSYFLEMKNRLSLDAYRPEILPIYLLFNTTLFVFPNEPGMRSFLKQDNSLKAEFENKSLVIARALGASSFARHISIEKQNELIAVPAPLTPTNAQFVLDNSKLLHSERRGRNMVRITSPTGADIEPGLIFVAMNYYPGWRARDAERQNLEVVPLFKDKLLAIKVKTKTKTIKLKYFPFYLNFWPIGMVALALSLAIVWRVRRRRSTSKNREVASEVSIT